MGQRLVGILTLIVGGAIVADLVIHPEGTKALVDGVTSFWRTGLNATLGAAS